MQCVEYVAGKIGWHHYHDAWMWWNKFKPPGYNKNRDNGDSHAPKKHDILVYDSGLPGSGGSGHVAWIDSVDEHKRVIHISEANFERKGQVGQRTISYSISHGKYSLSASHLYGWLST